MNACLVVCYHDGYHRPSSRHSMLDCVKNQQSKSHHLAFSMNFSSQQFQPTKKKKTNNTFYPLLVLLFYFCVALIPWVLLCFSLLLFFFWGGEHHWILLLSMNYYPVTVNHTICCGPLPSLFLSSSGLAAD